VETVEHKKQLSSTYLCMVRCDQCRRLFRYGWFWINLFTKLLLLSIFSLQFGKSRHTVQGANSWASVSRGKIQFDSSSPI